jgi:RNA polymerase sigma-70 factor, ECF subfamily
LSAKDTNRPKVVTGGRAIWDYGGGSLLEGRNCANLLYGKIDDEFSEDKSSAAASASVTNSEGRRARIGSGGAGRRRRSLRNPGWVYERKIFRLTQNITQNREDAEDAMQESFLKAFEHLGEFQGNSRFYTWLVRIAVNQALMKLRKRRPNQVSLDEDVDTGEDTIPRDVEDWGPSPEDRYEQSELSGILSQVIGELDPSFRIVFQLRDIEELSTEETAEALGLSVPAVKSRLLRARLKLRQKLNRYFRRSDNQ